MIGLNLLISQIARSMTTSNRAPSGSDGLMPQDHMDGVPDLVHDVVHAVEARGVRVVLALDSVGAPDIAELRAGTIVVNYTARTKWSAAITIAHLFGHLVQFMTYAKYERLVEAVRGPKPVILSDRFKAEFAAYETEAFAIGKGLLLEVTTFDVNVERFYQAFHRTDFELFWDYITTGRKTNAREFDIALEQNFLLLQGKDLVPFESITPPRCVVVSERSVTVD